MKTITHRMPSAACVLFMSFTFSACIGFRDNEVNSDGYAPAPRGTGRGKLSFEHALWNARLVDGKIVDLVPKHFLRKDHLLATRFVGTQLWQSGDFAAVRPANGGGDLHLDLRYIVASESRGAWWTLSRLLLHVVPTWTDTRCQLEATVKRGHRVIKRYSFGDTLTDFRWTPAVLLTPFMNPAARQIDINIDLYRRLIMAMRADGLIPIKAAPR